MLRHREIGTPQEVDGYGDGSFAAQKRPRSQSARPLVPAEKLAPSRLS